jgi:tetratricopeptide (TPR) repeat protein
MTARISFALVSGLIVLWHTTTAPAAEPTKAQIAKWIKELGDDSFDVREAASKHLWQAGRSAEEAVQAATQDADVEVRRRAVELWERFRWGIYPDTPKDIVGLIERYQAAEAAQRPVVAGELARTGGVPGLRALLKMARAEAAGPAREAIFDLLEPQMQKRARQLSVEDRPLLEQLLAVGVERDNPIALTHYVAYWMQNGKLDERIKFHQAVAVKDNKGQYERQALILTFLYRAHGDLAEARKAAARARRVDLEEALAMEAGDWKWLAERKELDGASPLEKLAFRAAFLRLAGKTKEYDQARTDLRKLAAEVERPGEARSESAKALFLNDDPDEALAILARGTDITFRFDVLSARLKYAEAFALVEGLRKAPSPELFTLDIRAARIQYMLGEKDKALAVFDHYRPLVKTTQESGWADELIAAEQRLGLKDRFEQHLLDVLTLTKPPPGLRLRTLARAFPSKAGAAEWWWLRLYSNEEKPEATLKRLRDVLTGKGEEKERTALLDKDEERCKMLPAEQGPPQFLALAEATLAAGLEKRGMALLEKTASPAALLRLGDLLSEKKKWEDAAKTYLRAWEKDTAQPLPLFLSGWALVQSGKEKEGKQRIEQAHALPLGDVMIRHEFALDLIRRGHVAESRRQTESILKLAAPRSTFHGEALRRAAGAALARGDIVTAADLHEKGLLVTLNSRIFYRTKSFYVTEPALVHRLRALERLRAGKLDEARREIALARTAMPGETELATLLVPELEKLGHKKDATELFEQVRAVHEKLCKDHPNYSGSHNSIAWLSGRCRRDLDGALAHARKAVELDPDNAGHLDTLAEVYFQRGDKEKAIETAKKVVALAPSVEYFRKALKRIEAGDASAPLPSTEE